MDTAWMVTAFFKNCFQAFFFSKIVATNEFDFQVVLGSYFLSIGSKLLAERFCPFGVIKDTNIICIKMTAHTGRITNAGDDAS